MNAGHFYDAGAQWPESEVMRAKGQQLLTASATAVGTPGAPWLLLLLTPPPILLLLPRLTAAAALRPTASAAGRPAVFDFFRAARPTPAAPPPATATTAAGTTAAGCLRFWAGRVAAAVRVALPAPPCSAEAQLVKQQRLVLVFRAALAERAAAAGSLSFGKTWKIVTVLDSASLGRTATPALDEGIAVPGENEHENELKGTPLPSDGTRTETR